MPAFAGRDPTQSLSIDPSEAAAAIEADDEPTAGSVAHPSLALGTHEARQHGDERTRVESPAARSKTPEPPRPGTSKPPPIPPRNEPVEHRLGEVLGSYRILEQLGKGGMGYVFRAEHVKLGREVALKLLRSDYARRRDAVARFFQEARTVNRVRHRNIVDVTDFVELDDGTTFIIMELLSGQSLGKWARSGVDLPRALAVLVQICDGLGAAHQVGVIHRDLKPDNIIVVPTSDGAELVKLLDFGVAKLVNRDDEDIGFQTAAGSVIGTPAYMSPEQAGGMVVDARSDIYSLGAIMYELFTGQPMFRGRSFGEYVRKHLTEMPVPPRATKGGAQLDPRLEATILRALEKDPNQRFSSIQELRDALLGMLGGMETHPPSFVSLTSSGIAPPQVPMIPAAMATVLPSGPQLPMPSGPHASPASGLHPLYYSQYASQIVPPPAPATPWYVWFVGGAIAVGLGVAAALWYAGGDASVKPAAQVAATQPAPQPIVTPSEPAKPEATELVELQFDSLPSGGVYADGRSAELCRTPCTFNVDPRDGGPKDRRTFVVRAEGYKDTSVVVDLTASKRDFKVTLEQLEPTPTVPVVEEKPTRPSKLTKRPVKQPATTKPADKPVDTAPKGDPDKLEDPTDGKPVVKPVKPTKTTIDPTDLADPFKKQRKR